MHVKIMVLCATTALFWIGCRLSNVCGTTDVPFTCSFGWANCGTMRIFVLIQVAASMSCREFLYPTKIPDLEVPCSSGVRRQATMGQYEYPFQGQEGRTAGYGTHGLGWCIRFRFFIQDNKWRNLDCCRHVRSRAERPIN